MANGHPDRCSCSDARNGWLAWFKQYPYRRPKRLLYCRFPFWPGYNCKIRRQQTVRDEAVAVGISGADSGIL